MGTRNYEDVTKYPLDLDVREELLTTQNEASFCWGKKDGSPMGVTNCSEGGCPRCASETPPGVGYDTCICVHAEQNTFLLAARNGNCTDNGTLYTTLRPCFGCTKEAIQAGIREIVFAKPSTYEDDLERVYQRLIAEAEIFFRQLR